MYRLRSCRWLLSNLIPRSYQNASSSSASSTLTYGSALCMENVSKRSYAACAAACSASWSTAFQHNLLASRSGPFSARMLTSASQPEQGKDGSKKEEVFDSLELTEEKINSITDKIPQRPVGVVEGTSYTLLILAAFGVLAYVVYQFVANFILEPTALQCFNHTLDTLKSDPRITVRLGSGDDIRAWGSNSQSRVARQQIPHQIYKDANGVEHVRIQFHMRGPSGTGLVNADMYKDANKQWQYTYLLVDVYSGSSQTPSRVHIVSPR